MSAPEDKGALRETLRIRVDALAPEYAAESDAGIFRRLIALPEFEAARVIFAYVSVGREPDTRRLIDYALERGKTVAVPESLPRGVMSARRLTSLGALVPGRYGIPAPPEGAEEIPPGALELVIVPAMTFDVDGYRLGYGGGYYDRYLPRTDAFTAGLARETLLLAAVPREAHDARVSALVTEARARRF
ncbi:MAG: 5-formyltetrahydrofolate cyclo-ligase [Oscillospiraceae bacterium]|nr:5-formyltetrahydrofolate cyclo-ligase [Oscillospiraceae bacterium]